tara:strand:+ start:49 stop:690 length:642 start_codon:yes stop_codon:yes gene_type:complete
MKKLLGIVVLGLLWPNLSFTEEQKYSLFGVYIGDNINKYQPDTSFEIKPNTYLIIPPKPNKDFVKYFAGINKKDNTIGFIGGIHKKIFVLGDKHKNREKLKTEWHKCSNETKEYVRIVANGKQFNDFIVREQSDFDKFDKLTRYIWLDKIKEHPFDSQFSVSLDCNKYGAVETPEDEIGLRMELILMDHRDLEQRIKDNEEFKKRKIDKSGLQ